MLILARKKNETIVINDQIEIEVLQIKGKTIRLGIQAPDSVRIIRGELATGIVPDTQHQDGQQKDAVNLREKKPLSATEPNVAGVSRVGSAEYSGNGYSGNGSSGDAPAGDGSTPIVATPPVANPLDGSQPVANQKGHAGLGRRSQDTTGSDPSEKSPSEKGRSRPQRQQQAGLARFLPSSDRVREQPETASQPVPRPVSTIRYNQGPGTETPPSERTYRFRVLSQRDPIHQETEEGRVGESTTRYQATCEIELPPTEWRAHRN